MITRLICVGYVHFVAEILDFHYY